MANPRPTPKPENLRPPWPPGTSGNPAGYSRGRRISDAIERLIEEMALDREFGATAIAMALGKKYMLKRKVCTFPENTEPAATGQGAVSADFSTPTGERPSRARRGSPR